MAFNKINKQLRQIVSKLPNCQLPTESLTGSLTAAPITESFMENEGRKASSRSEGTLNIARQRVNSSRDAQ
jgi:exonuclease VII small subunit